MIPAASILLTASAAIIFLLGILHLKITFLGDKMRPRDAALEETMKEISPQITRETTMWKTWIGFNASHSIGGMLFGLVYGYLALAHGSFLFRSPFLLAVGFLTLAGYGWLGVRYWFSVPFRGIALAALLYVAALVTNWISGSP
jgi:hypothetical protein